MKNEQLTIDVAIKKLEDFRAKIGGDACLILSLTDNDDYNRYVEVRVKHPSLAKFQEKT